MAAGRDPTRIECRGAGAMAIVAPHGELDLDSTAPLLAAVETAFTQRPLILAVDLRDVDFIDGSTVGALVDIGRRCESASRRMLLVGGGPQVERVIEASGLGGHFEMIAGLDQIASGEQTDLYGLDGT